MLLPADDYQRLAGRLSALDHDITPLPGDSPLWQHPKVVMTTHIGGAGSGMTARNDDLFIAQLERFLAGGTPHLLVEG